MDWAIRTIRHALLYYPRYIEGHQLLGQLLLQAGNHPEAAVEFKRVLGADPEHGAAWVALSNIYQAAGDAKEAFEHMQRACDLAPSDADLRRRLDGLVQTYLGNAAGQPEFTRPALGRIYARNGLYAKAIQEFRAVLVEEPARSDVQIALAEALWRDGRYVEAAELCHTILAGLPNALKANLILAAIQLNNGQSEAAQPYLSNARALDPENSVAHTLFGEASPLAPQVVGVEQLEEGGAEAGTLAVSLMPVDRPPRLDLEPARDVEKETDQEETARMSERDRPGEDIEIPDWLKGVGDDLLAEEAVAEQPLQPPGDAADADLDLATWLSRPTEGEIAAQTAAAGELAPAPAREAGPSPEPKTEIPVWLMGGGEPASLTLPETQAAEGEVHAPEPPAPEVPEWLRELQLSGPAPGQPAAEVSPPPPAATTAVLPDEAEAPMPNWLRRLRDDFRAEAGAGPADRPAAELPGMQADTSVPESALPAEEIITPEPTVQEAPEPPPQAEERLPEMERTLVIVKPDGVQRQLVGPIITRLEQRGLRIVALKMMQVSQELARRHYAVHQGKPFFEPLIRYITSGPVVVMVLEGTNAIEATRATMGATNPVKASPGTIRADYALEMGRNLVHGSDGPETAVAEIAMWFREDELLSYQRDVEHWILE